MALQVSEGTKQLSLDRLRMLARQPYPIGYVRMESFNLNYDDPSFTAVLAMYFNEQARQENKDSCSHYAIGCTLQQHDFNTLAGIDDRQLLYKYVEYIINYQVLTSQLTEGNVEDVRQELIDLANDLEIDTLFVVTEQNGGTECAEN